MLSMTFMDDVATALSSAVVAGVVSLCFRAAVDALTLCLANSLKRLSMIIVTDLPYLLSQVFLDKSFIHGSVSIDRYGEYAFLTAVVAAFLTTPFDVAQTRILVDSDGNFSNDGMDGGWRCRCCSCES
jgi:uncharacterized membrane protein YvlD (DUF360 family)